MKKPLIVLHHSGTLPTALAEFLTTNGAQVVALEDYDGLATLTHLLVSGDQTFAGLADLYATVDNDVRMVALGPVSDLPGFLANNGRMIVDPRWVETRLGRAQMEKFFLGAASVALDENFPTVKAGGNFKVVNPLRAGADADRLCAFAHAHGDDVVGVRAFFDHALYYLTYLRQAGVALAPFDVDYGHTGDDTVVQLHLPVNGFVAEHMLESFGDPTAREGHAWLLGVCARACDFLDVQYIEQISRLVISGTWRKGGARFAGLALNHIRTTAQIRAAIENAAWEAANAAEAAEADKPLPGALGEVALPPPPAEGKLKEDPKAAKAMVAFLVDSWSQAHPDRSVEAMDAHELTEIISGHPDMELASQLVEADLEYLLDTVKDPDVAASYNEDLERVRGGLAEDEESQKILGDRFAKEVAQKVLGGLTEEEVSQLVKGTPTEEDDFQALVKGGMPEEEARLVVKGGKEKVEQALVRIHADKPEAKGAWKVRSLPGGNIQQQFQGHLRSALTQRFGDQDPEAALAQLSPEERQALIEESMKAAVGDVSAHAAPDQLVHVLSDQLGRNADDMNMVVRSSQAETKKAETELVVKGLMANKAPPPPAGDAGAAMLREKIKQLEDENKKIKSNLDATRTELRALRDSRQVMDKGTAAASKASQELQSEALTTVDEKMALLRQAVAEGGDAEKLRAVFEREQKLIQLAKDAETEVRKAKLESTQKEGHFAQELEKAQRSLKSRDLVLEKLKDTMNMMVQKKDKQITDLTSKLQAASELQAQSQALFQQSKVLEQEKNSLTRMAEMYKMKLATTTSNLEKYMAMANNNKKDDEARRAQMEKQRLEVSLQAADRELEKLRSKVDVNGQELSRLRADAKSNADKMRGLIDQVKNLSANANSAKFNEELTAKAKLAAQDLTAMTHKHAKAEQTIKDLEAKVSDMAAQMAKGGGQQGDAGLKKQVVSLEATVKKLTGDIAAANNLVTEAKKEVNKMRSEKTALQNQIDKMKKDAAKTDKKAA